MKHLNTIIYGDKGILILGGSLARCIPFSHAPTAPIRTPHLPDPLAISHFRGKSMGDGLLAPKRLDGLSKAMISRWIHPDQL